MKKILFIIIFLFEIEILIASVVMLSIIDGDAVRLVPVVSIGIFFIANEYMKRILNCLRLERLGLQFLLGIMELIAALLMQPHFLLLSCFIISPAPCTSYVLLVSTLSLLVCSILVMIISLFRICIYIFGMRWNKDYEYCDEIKNKKIKKKQMITVLLIPVFLYCILFVALSKPVVIENNAAYCEEIAQNINKIGLKNIVCTKIIEKDEILFEFAMKNELIHYDFHTVDGDVLKVRKYLTEYMAEHPNHLLNEKTVVISYPESLSSGVYTDTHISISDKD